MESARGTHLALLGPSGSGKTSLLRLLAGLMTVDQGRMSLVLYGRVIAREAKGYLIEAEGQLCRAEGPFDAKLLPGDTVLLSAKDWQIRPLCRGSRGKS